MFKVMEAVKVVQWQRILRNPKQLKRWLQYQAVVVYGKQTFEIAIIASILSRRIFTMYKHNGALFVALYLKQCTLCLKRSLSQYPHGCRDGFSPSEKSPPVSLTRSGMPRIILKNHRKVISKINERSFNLVRIYLSLFSFYKLIVVETKPDFSKIEGSYSGKSPGLRDPSPRWVKEPKTSFSLLDRMVFNFSSRECPIGFSSYLSWSSAPRGGSVQALGLLFDSFGSWARLLDVSKLMYAHLGWLRLIHRSTAFPGVIWKSHPNSDNWSCAFVRELADWGSSSHKDGIWDKPLFPFYGSVPSRSFEVEHLCYIRLIPYNIDPIYFASYSPVGKLGFKQEAAGKVRIFAMIDPVRQRICLPIHNWCLGILSEIPMDGTFDQEGAIHKLLKRTKSVNFWCFDLTAATDRMPLGSYFAFWNDIFGPEFARIWCMMMSSSRFAVSRRYCTPELKSLGVAFKVGQPLGALSSWPTFALVHHILVQRSAICAGIEGVYSGYALLGDDIVIDHPKVAMEYKRLNKMLGVEISERKSVLSNNRSLEFASKFFWFGWQCSPVSFGLVRAANVATATFVGPLLNTLIFRDRNIREVLRWQGVGYKSLSRVRYSQFPIRGKLGKYLARKLLVLKSPIGPFPQPLEVWLNLLCSYKECCKRFSLMYRYIPILELEVRDRLLERVLLSDWKPNINTSFERDPWLVEYYLVRPWFSLRLNMIRALCLGLIQGVPALTMGVGSYDVPMEMIRPSINRRFLRYGSYCIYYDRFQALVKEQPPPLIESSLTLRSSDHGSASS